MSNTLHGSDLVPAEDDAATVVVVEPTPTPAPTVVASVGETEAARRDVICPECGTAALVTLNRREAEDFCPRCDFPLFWTPSKVVLDRTRDSEESLRRLPGAAGRQTVGSMICPHCAEVNLLTAEVCVRCTGLMHPPAPPPPVRFVAPPPPAPEPEPVKPSIPDWVWILGGATLAVLIALIVYFIAR